MLQAIVPAQWAPPLSFHLSLVCMATGTALTSCAEAMHHVESMTSSWLYRQLSRCHQSREYMSTQPSAQNTCFPIMCSIQAATMHRVSEHTFQRACSAIDRSRPKSWVLDSGRRMSFCKQRARGCRQRSTPVSATGGSSSRTCAARGPRLTVSVCQMMQDRCLDTCHHRPAGTAVTIGCVV